ncbi:MAG: RsmE family RNA methyltransferase [Acidimicrobiia bacterium]
MSEPGIPASSERPRHAGAFPSSVRAVAHVYVDRLDDDAVVEDDDAHHLRRVLRVRDGEVVTAADGHGRWRAYRVMSVDAPAISLHATTELAHEPRLVPELTVACALTKGERPELVVQKLTELGVDGVTLVRAARSVVQWDDARAARALTRLVRIAREAGAQCRRARLPLLDGPVSVEELARCPGLVVADRVGLSPAALPVLGDGTWTVAVGPEGGFDDDELATLAGAPRLTLGPHVLRAETAAIAAAAALVDRRAVGTDRSEREE